MNNILNYFLKFQTNAEKVSAKMERLESSTKKVGDTAQKMGGKLSRTVDKINSKLNAIQLNAIVDNISHVADGLNSISDPGLKLGASLADLSAITDVTGTKLKQIEGYARANAKAFGGDAAAGVESYKLILSQLTPEIAKAPKALQQMGDHVSILSKTMGGDTAAATEVLTTAMNQYQVSTKDPIAASKEMSRMMNIMAAAAKEGSAELPEQKQALEQSGMAAKNANVSFAETAAAIQILDKAGKKGSEGGVALRNTLATLSQGRFLPKDVREELSAAGVDINVLGDKTLSLADRMKPLKNIMNDSALVTKLFGKENNNAAIALISGIQEQERLTKAVEGTNTAREQAAIVMESDIEKNARLKARVDDLKISFFNLTGGTLGYVSVLGDVARDVGNLIPLFSGAAQMISFMSNATKMQALWAGITSTATSVWTSVQWALNAAMTANPIGIIIVAIAALAAGITWVVSKTQGWGEAWDHVVNGAKHLWEAFVLTAKAHFNTMVSAIMIGLNLIKIGWYKFKETMGIGDSSQNRQMIADINADTQARKESVIAGWKKVNEADKKARKEFATAGGSLTWKDEKETEQNKSQDSLGISPVIAPGTGESISGDSGGSVGGRSGGKKTNEAIANGGNKQTNITISFNELIGVLNIKGKDFKDTAKQLQDQSTDALVRALAMASTASS